MLKKCLLLKFPDEREVFTKEKYHHNLLEFAKTFNVKIMKVEAEEPELLHPKEIARIFCDLNERKNHTHNYQILDSNQTEKTTPNKNRKQMLERVCDIRSHIEDQFLEGKTVRIKELYDTFKKHQISVSTLYRHLSHVKNKLKSKGCKFIKISTGCYKIT